MAGRKKKPQPATPAGRGKQGYTVGSGGGSRAGTAAKPKASSGRPWPLIAIGALVAIGVVVVAVALGSSLVGGSQSFAAGMKAGNCTQRLFPKANPQPTHLTEGEKPPKYDSDPPVEGRHDPVPALWGIYDTPVAQTTLIHNMEHAGFVIQYGDRVSPKVVSDLTANVLKDREFTVMAPYPKLGDKVAFEHWDDLTLCTSVQPGVLAEFRSHRNTPVGSTESESPRDWSQEARLPGF